MSEYARQELLDVAKIIDDYRQVDQTLTPADMGMLVGTLRRGAERIRKLENEVADKGAALDEIRFILKGYNREEYK